MEVESLIVEGSRRMIGVEVKSGATVASDWFTALAALPELLARGDPHRTVEARLIYGGETGQTRSGVQVIPWREVQEVEWG